MTNLQKNNLPFVSIIIPCRNEEKFISKCLDSIIANDYPKERLEILIVDGISEDRTREILAGYVKRCPFIKVLDNPKKFTPFAFNLGIKNAKGEIIILMGAHTTYQRNYIQKCVRYLDRYNADNVGGVLRAISGENALAARAIAFVLSCPFGVGNAYYRTGRVNKPKWVDTVFGGCYKKEIFKKIGFFNENLIRSQDLEFNLRLKKAGGKILLIPEIVSYYYPKFSFKDFFIHNIEDGIWAVYPLKFVKKPLKLRHYIPLIFVSGLIGTGILGTFFSVFFWLFISIISLYLLVSFYFSTKIAIKKKEIGFLFVLLLVFAGRHIGYGFGSILGIVKLFLPAKK